ncbi:MAG: keto-deoxy-phosphogluconate aldolase [Zetaproteobacteria bacterium]|nr:keto-deoxy-phosphogluconate aldolase [Pseudobdellovibrionaceae bacterium]
MRMLDILGSSPVIPVVTIDHLNDCVPLARALIRGGIKVMEVTLRTDCGLEAISQIAAEVPEMIVGAGTLTSPADLESAVNAGAKFGVSPGISRELLQVAKQANLPFLPGIQTPSELMFAAQYGYKCFKIFPAQVNVVKALMGPFSQYHFCPTGGIGPDNMNDYFRLKGVISVGGSWLAPKDHVQNHLWDEVAKLASTALGQVNRNQ